MAGFYSLPLSIGHRVMGRYNLKHIDQGLIYIPVYDDTSKQEINQTVNKHKKSGKTVVLFRSGKNNMHNILKELIKTALNT